jgi:hypothetical protein
MPKMTATQCVTNSVNTSFWRLISPDELVKIFKNEVDWELWLGHLDVFFGEVPPKMIQKFMAENNLSLDQLSGIYDSLHPVMQGEAFREMRNAALGNFVQGGGQTT